MNCDDNIHDSIKEEMNICPFCEQIISLHNKNDNEPCCDSQEMIHDNGSIVCKNCGIVDRYDLIPDYIDFYENIYKFKRKSV